MHIAGIVSLFMGSRAAVFLHNGLGDGIAWLVLSNNLHLNGWHVDTYQNTIQPMQSWFPHLSVISYPTLSDLPRILSMYDWFFVANNDTDMFVQALIREGKRRFPERLKVIYMYPSKNIVNEPYYADCLTDPSLSVPDNMMLFCEKILHLPKCTRNNGFIPPDGLTYRQHEKRVLIHPTSSREGKNWPKEKYVKLALHLRERGYQVVFLPGGLKEKESWQDVADLGFDLGVFDSLDLLARYIYESGYLIGNDSGLGHLASSLKIPTLTFCRRKTLANLWAPGFYKNEVVAPSCWIPNVRGFRLRDMHWKKFISVKRALRAFDRLLSNSISYEK